MNKTFNAIKSSIHSFAKDEEGAQVVEYALIIAVVSIGLVVALRGLAAGEGDAGPFAEFVQRVTNCLTPGEVCE